MILTDRSGNVMITADVPAADGGEVPEIIFWGHQAFYVYGYNREPYVHRLAHTYALPDPYTVEAKPAYKE